MAKCAFCGNKTKAFPKKFSIGLEEIPVCDECYAYYNGADDLELADVVISAGFYDRTEPLSEWAEEKRAETAETEAKQAEYNRKHYFGICPKCGGEMVEQCAVGFVTDEPILPALNLTRWNTGRRDFMEVGCESCGYTEFYRLGKYRKPEAAASEGSDENRSE